MPASPLTDAELDRALADLTDWRLGDDGLTASFTVDRGALPGFYAALAAAEDEAGHHARVTVLYTTVDLALNTHDAGGAVTAEDTAMAERVTRLVADHGGRAARG
ncbi:4a-hydroxytetrahydrobiopterin dehydratase [Streptomyces bohaiensis]|uniref:Putative pterin-4-alpha-carbinolamine dehydratase n=1 Tax=Streptomyces bohaiensis TaxID=1431344 RepID=A0ABX1CJJ5_9ACTN|nr:4a-hydroxytetrahydrobiopterin dehydratase [Streptomyces bohaiensis]NJQ16729.1 4a-hydroxytetrahydrobiopterin dehydratase [Streptomyces bohaiensis]